VICEPSCSKLCRGTSQFKCPVPSSAISSLSTETKVLLVSPIIFYLLPPPPQPRFDQLCLTTMFPGGHIDMDPHYAVCLHHVTSGWVPSRM
jgi:hypothetical protein